MRNVTCNSCGWVHIGVPKEFAESQMKEIQKDLYNGNKASLERYVRCIHCGGPAENFRDFKQGDCPDGCTINPIIIGEE